MNNGASTIGSLATSRDTRLAAARSLALLARSLRAGIPGSRPLAHWHYWLARYEPGYPARGRSLTGTIGSLATSRDTRLAAARSLALLARSGARAALSA